MVKTLLIYKSIHHQNSKKIAEVFSRELNARLVEADQLKIDQLDNYQLIGFGSGIYNQKHHRALFDLIAKIPVQSNKPCFVFSTASIEYKKMNEALIAALQDKGFVVVDQFICRGFMDYSFIKYFFGGINRKKPGDKEFQRAEEFSRKLLTKI